MTKQTSQLLVTFEGLLLCQRLDQADLSALIEVGEMHRDHKLNAAMSTLKMRLRNRGRKIDQIFIDGVDPVTGQSLISWGLDANGEVQRDTIY